MSRTQHSENAGCIKSRTRLPWIASIQSIATEVYRATIQPQIFNDHIIVKNNRDNQISGDSNIVCED